MATKAKSRTEASRAGAPKPAIPEPPTYITRAVVFNLDPTPAQQRLLWSYFGAVRVAFNWVLARVKENMDVRAAEREAGVAEEDLTPALSWDPKRLGKAWNAEKADVAPWWQEVSMHAFRSGVNGAADGLKNFRDSRNGTRKGRRMGFPRFKSRNRSKPTVTFVETNHQLSWLESADVVNGCAPANGHRIRLMQPRYSPDRNVSRRREQLEWIHTTQPTNRLAKKIRDGTATIQSVTISYTGGGWQVALSVRYLVAPPLKPVKHHGGSIGVDLGIKHLATLDRPVPGLTDEDGHIANPRVLERQLTKLARLDRKLARCMPGSKNRTKVKQRRARLHGTVAKTRALELHTVTTALAGGFDMVAIEDLNVAGMSTKKRHLGRALADVALGEVKRQVTYKCTDRGTTLVVVPRFYPSSKTCSFCRASGIGTVKAKLGLWERVFECDACGMVLDRDVNAARNVKAEAERMLTAQLEATRNTEDKTKQHVAELRPETRNAVPRTGKTRASQDTPALATVRTPHRGADEKAEPRSHRQPAVA